ncbi:MAG: hypothetical protein ACRCVG_06915 [Methanobacteriaceae archaeon]
MSKYNKLSEYNKFLYLMNNGWEGTIRFPEKRKKRKNKTLKGISVAFTMVGLGSFAGAMAADSVSGGGMKIEGGDFKVKKEGIFVKLANFRRDELILEWKDMINIYKSPKGTSDLVVLKMVDGSEITLSAPFKSKFISAEFFTDYFIDYVLERACGRLNEL